MSRDPGAASQAPPFPLTFPMSSHQVTTPRSWRDFVPFGVGAVKPNHFRDMGRIVWENRDNLPYAWKVLSQGVCDGCALGVAGLHDWTMKGPHLCMTRLNLAAPEHHASARFPAAR